jgi:hypothetical protein
MIEKLLEKVVTWASAEDAIRYAMNKAISEFILTVPPLNP